MSQPTAANAETAERCFGLAMGLLRTHRTVEPRAGDGPVAMCACGRPALGCEVNTALRDAGLLSPLHSAVR